MMRRGRTLSLTIRPDRETFRGLESGGFQGWEFKGLGVRVVRGLFAASLVHNARGVSAALVHDARGLSAVF